MNSYSSLKKVRIQTNGKIENIYESQIETPGGVLAPVNGALPVGAVRNPFSKHQFTVTYHRCESR